MIGPKRTNVMFRLAFRFSWSIVELVPKLLLIFIMIQKSGYRMGLGPSYRLGLGPGYQLGLGSGYDLGLGLGTGWVSNHGTGRVSNHGTGWGLDRVRDYELGLRPSRADEHPRPLLLRQCQTPARRNRVLRVCCAPRT